MRLIPESKDTNCHAKAVQRGQKTFTLIEQDKTSVRTIAFWILENIETAPPEKLREALEDCIEWRKFEKKKCAD